MSSVFRTFFEIGSAVGISLLITLVIPAFWLKKKILK